MEVTGLASSSLRWEVSRGTGYELGGVIEGGSKSRITTRSTNQNCYSLSLSRIAMDGY